MKLLKLVPDNTNIRFLRWRVPFYVISLLLMAASITMVLTRGLNFGVDFIGGQMIRVTFEQSASAPVAELRETESTPSIRASVCVALIVWVILLDMASESAGSCSAPSGSFIRIET